MTTTPRIASPPAPPAAVSPAEEALFAALRDALRPAYQLVRRLGEGGMGAVYLAREPSLKRDVAVKVMLPWLATDPTARARFEREAQAVAAIAHPHVINIFGTGELADGTPYFVMQFVNGRGLDVRVAQDGPLSMREARRVLAEVAAALAAAHKRGIVHRDIKAANVLQDAESGRVVVTDFGIAAVRDSAELPNLKLTQPDSGSPGTPAYMAPEQLLGEPTTEASDVYAFGLLAYELLTGAGPFTATSPHEMAAAQLRDAPPPLSRLRPDMDPALEQLVRACLAKRPEERPPAAQLVQALPPVDVLSLEWPPPGLEALAGRLAGLSRRIGLGTGLLVASLLGLATAEPSGDSLPPGWLLTLAAIAGAVWLLGTIFGARVFLAGLGTALRRGYPWTALVEVVADRRGDTGALVTGRREYAVLDRAARSRLRYGRVVAAACGFVAGIAPLLMIVPAMRLAARGGSPGGLVAVAALPSLALLLVAGVLRWWEHRVARLRARPPRGPAATAAVARPVVDAWAESFAAAATGQPLGGRVPHPVAARLVLAALLLAGLAGTLAVLPIISIPAIGSVFFSIAVPRYNTAAQRIRIAQAARPWAPAVDPAVTPQAAGRAFHAVTMPGNPPESRGDFVLPDAALPPFPAAGSAGPFEFPPAQRGDSILGLAARRALTPEQRAYLAAAAAHPAWPAVRTAARAGDADIIGTRHSAEQLADLPLISFPLPRLANIQNAAHAATLAAAHHLAAGRPAQAEAALSDAIGLGLNIMDHGVWLIETLVGAATVRFAASRLETLYRVTGRAAEAERMRAARDSARDLSDRLAEAAENAARRPRSTARAYRMELDRIMRDSTLPASWRWEFVHQYQFLPCAETRALVFGLGPDVDTSIATFARQAVRSRSDSLWFRKQLASPFGPSTSFPVRVAQLDARVLGNPRIAACAALLAP